MEKTPEQEKLRNSIGMQLQFYRHSGASLEDTVDRIMSRAEAFAAQEKANMIHRDRVEKIIGHILSDIDDCSIAAKDVVISDYLPTTT